MDISNQNYRLLALGFAIVSLILTALLLIWPNILISANRLLKKWISTDMLEKKLNQTHDIDAQLLGLRKIMGGIMLLLSVIFILILIR